MLLRTPTGHLGGCQLPEGQGEPPGAGLAHSVPAKAAPKPKHDDITTLPGAENTAGPRGKGETVTAGGRHDQGPAQALICTPLEGLICSGGGPLNSVCCEVPPYIY